MFQRTEKKFRQKNEHKRNNNSDSRIISSKGQQVENGAPLLKALRYSLSS